jgi:hypothetical protein
MDHNNEKIISIKGAGRDPVFANYPYCAKNPGFAAQLRDRFADLPSLVAAVAALKVPATETTRAETEVELVGFLRGQIPPAILHDSAIHFTATASTLASALSLMPAVLFAEELHRLHESLNILLAGQEVTKSTPKKRASEPGPNLKSFVEFLRRCIVALSADSDLSLDMMREARDALTAADPVLFKSIILEAASLISKSTPEKILSTQMDATASPARHISFYLVQVLTGFTDRQTAAFFENWASMSVREGVQKVGADFGKGRGEGEKAVEIFRLILVCIGKTREDGAIDLGAALHMLRSTEIVSAVPGPKEFELILERYAASPVPGVSVQDLRNTRAVLWRRKPNDVWPLIKEHAAATCGSTIASLEASKKDADTTAARHTSMYATIALTAEHDLDASRVLNGQVTQNVFVTKRIAAQAFKEGENLAGHIIETCLRVAIEIKNEIAAAGLEFDLPFLPPLAGPHLEWLVSAEVEKEIVRPAQPAASAPAKPASLTIIEPFRKPSLYVLPPADELRIFLQHVLVWGAVPKVSYGDMLAVRDVLLTGDAETVKQIILLSAAQAWDCHADDILRAPFGRGGENIVPARYTVNQLSYILTALDAGAQVLFFGENFGFRDYHVLSIRHALENGGNKGAETIGAFLYLTQILRATGAAKNPNLNACLAIMRQDIEKGAWDIYVPEKPENLLSSSSQNRDVDFQFIMQTALGCSSLTASQMEERRRTLMQTDPHAVLDMIRKHASMNLGVPESYDKHLALKRAREVGMYLACLLTSLPPDKIAGAFGVKFSGFVDQAILAVRHGLLYREDTEWIKRLGALYHEDTEWIGSAAQATLLHLFESMADLQPPVTLVEPPLPAPVPTASEAATAREVTLPVPVEDPKPVEPAAAAILPSKTQKNAGILPRSRSPTKPAEPLAPPPDLAQALLGEYGDSPLEQLDGFASAPYSHRNIGGMTLKEVCGHAVFQRACNNLGLGESSFIRAIVGKSVGDRIRGNVRAALSVLDNAASNPQAPVSGPKSGSGRGVPKKEI